MSDQAIKIGLEAGMKAVVTGGGGFLGKAVVKKLLEKGLKVRTFSRKKYKELEDLGVECFTGEISDGDAVLNACEGMDIVFHVAAKAGIEEPYEEYLRINYHGTERVVEACKKHGIRKLVYTSSPSVVFDGKNMEGVDESVPYPAHYEAHYPKTKAMAERHVLNSNSSELATVALRPHLIWGPGDNHLGPRLIAKAKAGKLRIVGDGQNKVDTIYIENAADAHIQAAEKLAPRSIVSGKVYFISQADPRPISEIINAILKAAGLEPVDRMISPKVAWFAGLVIEKTWKLGYTLFGFVSEPPLNRWVANEMATAHWFDISAAKRDFGFVPKVSIDEGMARLGEHLREK